MERQKRDATLAERAVEYFDLPGQAVVGMNRITVTGGRKVQIENHKGIVEYGDQAIQIDGGKQLITVTGSRLSLKSMSNYELVIAGAIEKVEMTPKTEVRKDAKTV